MIWIAPHGLDSLGMLPFIFRDSDPRPAVEQIEDRYDHGGGFNPFEGFTLHDADQPLCARMVYREGEPTEDGSDPEEVHEVARGVLTTTAGTEVLILFSPSDWMAIVQADGSYVVCRMD